MARLRSLFIVLALLMTAQQASAAPVILKLSFFTSDRSNAYECQIKPFVDAVNREGGGLVEIKVYFSGSISPDQSGQSKLVRDGTADLATVVLGQTPEEFPDSAILELPGVFKNEGESSRVFTRPVEAGALRGYAPFFVVGAFVSAGESIHSRKPLTSLAELKGQTIRVNNTIESSILKKLGAVPLLLPINRTMDGLSQGTLDGATVPPSMLFEFGFGRPLGRLKQMGVSIVMDDFGTG